MKKKILSLLAAFFMLFGTSAMAQVDSTLEGDVNGDGVVDIADITAVIAIIKQNAEANPTYYWYVGQENPASMTSISPIVDKASGKEGWRLIGNTVDTYTSTNKLSTGWVLQSLPDMTYMYIALPSTSSDTDLCPRDGFGNDGTTVGMYTRLTDKVINGVTYKIYKSTDDLLDAFGDDIF